MAINKYTVTTSCLRAIRKLQKMGHLPSSAVIFKDYAAPGNKIGKGINGSKRLLAMGCKQFKPILRELFRNSETCCTVLMYMCRLTEKFGTNMFELQQIPLIRSAILSNEN